MDGDADVVGAVLATVQVGDTSDTGIASEDTTALNFLNGLPNDWYSISGNHDITTERDSDEYATDYGMSAKNFVVDLGPCVGIFLGYPVIESSVTWLDTQLTTYADRICLIFSHVPIYNTTSGSATAGFYLEQSDAVVTVLGNHTNAKAFITGHTHTEVSDTIVMLKRCGSHDVACIAASTPYYTIPDDQTDFYTVYISVLASSIEVRYRCFTSLGWLETMYTITIE